MSSTEDTDHWTCGNCQGNFHFFDDEQTHQHARACYRIETLKERIEIAEERYDELRDSASGYRFRLRRNEREIRARIRNERENIKYNKAEIEELRTELSCLHGTAFKKAKTDRKIRPPRYTIKCKTCSSALSSASDKTPKDKSGKQTRDKKRKNRSKSKSSQTKNGQ